MLHVSGEPWRVIPILDAPGATQMVLDAWLLEQHRQGLHPSTLRFYTWSPFAISLGHHQRHTPDHWRSLAWQGTTIDIVRRPTGGRAVLHQGDLTYAVITSGLAGDRQAVYRYLCEFLVQGWRSLGIDLHYGQAGRGYIHNPDCFGTATVADLVDSDGNKLVGSAQLRRGTAILQHGSMRLAPDPDLFGQVFGTAAVDRLPTGLLSRWGCSSLAAAQVHVMEALTIAATHCFQVECVLQPLSAAEWQAITTHQAVNLNPKP